MYDDEGGDEGLENEFDRGDDGTRFDETAERAAIVAKEGRMGNTTIADVFASLANARDES